MNLPHTMLKRNGNVVDDAITDAIERSLNHLEAHPFANTKILPPLAFPAFPTTLRVCHGLGYRPTGWLMIKNSAFISFADVTPATEPDPSNFAVLAVNIATTVTLAVF